MCPNREYYFVATWPYVVNVDLCYEFQHGAWETFTVQKDRL